MIRGLASAEANKVLSDRDFDRIFPKKIQKLARVHWTPVKAARRAALFLARANDHARILDVGSGAGKFCLVGASATRAKFTGIEMHAGLVHAARDLAKLYKIQNVRFVAGDALAENWSSFDGIYLYNPFAQTLEGNGVESEAYWQQIEAASAKLASLPSGSRVAIFNGYGAPLPAALEVQEQETFGVGLLELCLRV